MKSEFESPGIRCWHDGDGALIVTLEGDRPSISAAVLDAYHRAIALAEARFEMLVIGEGQKDFAYGADLGDEVQTAATGDTAPLDRVLDYYQQTMLALRHARVPTIAVTRGVAVSGGCEVLMHCTRVVAAPKSPIGLVETSIGVIPGGGGVKELARRAAARAGSGDPMPHLERAFAVLSGARIAYARDAKGFDLLAEDDVVTDDADLLSVAKRVGRALRQSGYAPPPRNPPIRILGSEACERLIASQASADITPHQRRVNADVARVLCGGEGPAREVPEQTLLDLERRYFLPLAQSPETQARLLHLRNTGTVLAN